MNFITAGNLTGVMKHDTRYPLRYKTMKLRNEAKVLHLGIRVRYFIYHLEVIIQNIVGSF